MTKAYYTDPLAAAWMAKHHGFLFDASVRPVFTPGGHPALQFIPERFYIHPDSIAMLNPCVGDVMSGGNAMGGSGIRTVISNDKKNIDSAKFLLRREMRIIQRNGLAFHWPEWEE